MAWHLHLQLEAAAAEAEPVTGASLDWSKAFERVRLVHLETAMAAAGVPPWMSLPLFGSYRADRRLRAAGAQGPQWRPSAGNLPGCPIAIYAMALLVRPWQ